jgi:hypothetical protein
MILKSLEQFQAVIPTTAAIEDFADLHTYIRSAEIWLKNNILGKNLYELIEETSDSSSGEDDDLLNLCRSVIANHAYWDAIPFLDVVHTNQGFGVIQNNNLVPASKERVERLREQCLVRRDSEAELLIQYLEENDIYHDDWKGSPAYSILSECLISTATELQLYGQWTGTRKDFLQLKPKLLQETMLRLYPVFSKSYIEELIEKRRDDELTKDDDLVVIELLKFALGSLVNGNIEAAEKIAADALRYMDSNLSDFKTYSDSREYAARIATGYTNECRSQIFSSLY